MPEAKMDRRSFLLGPAVAGSWALLAPAVSPSCLLGADGGEIKVSDENGNVRINGGSETLEWLPKEDRFTLRDKQKRTITSGNMQPAIAVARGSGNKGSFCSPGKVASYKAGDGNLTITYEGVNQGARLTATWRGDENGLWLDPFNYETSASELIVALHYFATCRDGKAEPSLENNYASEHN